MVKFSIYYIFSFLRGFSIVSLHSVHKLFIFKTFQRTIEMNRKCHHLNEFYHLLLSHWQRFIVMWNISYWKRKGMSFVKPTIPFGPLFNCTRDLKIINEILITNFSHFYHRGYFFKMVLHYTSILNDKTQRNG